MVADLVVVCFPQHGVYHRNDRYWDRYWEPRNLVGL